MSKKIEFQVSANTNEAKKSLNEFSKKLGSIGKDINAVNKQKLKLGVETSTVSNEYNEEQIHDAEFHDDKKEVRGLTDVLDRLTKVLNRKEDTDKNKSGKPSTVYNGKSENNNKKKVNNTHNQEDPENILDSKKTFGELFTKITTLAGAAGNALRYINQGASRSASLESEALRIYNRTGAYGNDFNKARKEAYDVGRQYGYSNIESLSTQEELISAGFTSKEDLNEDTGQIMATSRAYGLNPLELTSGYNQRVKEGTFSNGDAKEYTDIIASTIKQNNMVGRESEQVQALNELVDILTNGKINVSSDDFKNIAGYQSVLSNLTPELRGERGAQLLEQGSSFFNKNDQTMIMAAGYGTDLGYDLEGLWEAKKVLEKAQYGDPEAIQKVFGNLQSDLAGDDTTIKLMMESATSLSTEEVEALFNAYKNNDAKTIESITSQYKDKGNQEELLKNAQSSKAYTYETYANDRENAQINAGNLQNAATNPFKKVYSSLPSSLQTIGGIGAAAGAGAIGGNLIGGLGKGLGNLIKGGNASDAVSKMGASLSSKLANAAPTIGKVAGGIGIGATVLHYGSEAVDHFKNKENQEGVGTIGAGVGTIGGGLAGAKAGAALGTLVAPGIGTAIGGALGSLGGAFIGTKGGRAAGEGIYGLVAGDEETEDEKIETVVSEKHKEKSLVSRKEQITKREENLLDRIEAGDLFNIEIKGDQKEDRTGSDKKDINTSSDYARKRSAFARAYASSALNGGVMNNGPLVGADNEEKIWNYFKGQGFSDPAIAGIIGNFSLESGLKPGQNQLGGGPGHGLAQWEGARWQGLQDFAASRGTERSDLQTQLDFVMHELNKDFSDQWLTSYKSMTDVDQATIKFQNDYERPGVPNTQKRLSYANAAYNRRNSQTGSNVRSFAVGNDRIDQDQVAYVHKDEAILNKFDAKEYRENAPKIELPPLENIENKQSNNNSNQFTINFQPTINANDSNVVEEIKQMVLKGIEQAMNQLEQNSAAINLNQIYSRSPI